MKHRMLVITGANGQIGSFLARHYASSHEPLLLLYHKDFQRIADLEGQEGIMLRSCDLSSSGEIHSCLESACEVLDAVPSGLIHTAAIRSYDAKTVAESDPLIFYEVLCSNIVMAYNILRACLPGMIANQFGRIVVFGSNVVLTGLRNGAAYSAAKAALVNMVQSTALESASANVLINAISPAPVETDLEADYSGEYLQFRRKYFEEFRRQSPTGKLVSKEEIRHFVDLLLSESLQNFTGENIVIDGGFSSSLKNSIPEDK